MSSFNNRRPLAIEAIRSARFSDRIGWRKCPLIPKAEHLLTEVQWPLVGVKDDDLNVHGFCTSAKDYANFDLVCDRKEPTSVVDSVGYPKMSFGHVADVDAAMSKRYGMFAVVGMFANKFERVARSDLLVDIPAAINSLRRFAFELCYPSWI